MYCLLDVAVSSPNFVKDNPIAPRCSLTHHKIQNSCHWKNPGISSVSMPSIVLSFYVKAANISPTFSSDCGAGRGLDESDLHDLCGSERLSSNLSKPLFEITGA